MIERKQGLSQRLGVIGLLAGLTATGFAVKGCHNLAVEQNGELHSQAGEQITSIFTSNFPEEIVGNGIERDVTDPTIALKESKRILDTFGSLLGVSHPLRGSRYPFINHSNWTNGGISGDDLRELEDFKNANITAQSIRGDMADQLEECADTIAQLARESHTANDPVACEYATALAPRLHVLSKRMRSGQLMVNDNVLQTRTKFGEFAELIGKTKHYDEALAEIQTLLEHLEKRSEQTE